MNCNDLLLIFGKTVQVARNFLNIPIGTASTERVFKIGDDVITDDRNRLLPHNAAKLIFAKVNLEAVGYDSFNSPEPPDFTCQVL